MPSLLEDLCAIGAAGQVAGVSSATRDVPCAKGVSVVGDFSSVDTEKIVALRTDLVVGIPAQRHLIEPLRSAGVHVELFDDDSYASIFTDISALGGLTGHEIQAMRLNRALRAETVRLTRNLSYKHRPRVFVVLGTGPIYTVGSTSYIATLIRLAGGSDAVTSLDGAYGAYSPEALLRSQPDAIITDGAVGLPAVLDREPWRSLNAVKHHHVFILTNASLLERPGPHYNEGLRWLIERLKPLAS